MYEPYLRRIESTVAQGLTDSGSSMDLDGIQNFLIFTLAGVIGLVVLWRIFKTYLSSNDSGGIESQGKAQLNNMANAGIAIGGLAVAAVFIGWVATLIMEAV